MYVPQDEVDSAVVRQVIYDWQSPQFLDQLMDSARKTAGQTADPAADLRKQLSQIDTQVSRALDLALELDDPGPATRKVNELESRRKGLAEEIARIDRERHAEQALQSISRQEVKDLVSGLAEELEASERPRLKGVLQAAIEQVVLDPKTLDCRIHYRITVADTVEMASPTGFEPVSPP